MKRHNYLFESSILEKPEEHLSLIESSLITNGKVMTEKDGIDVVFNRTSDISDVFITTIKLDQSQELSGMAACLKLENWERIDYIALGLVSNREFKHIKINHFRQNIATIVEMSLHSLAYKIQNGFSLPVTLNCDSIRIFIKGVPEKNHAKLSVHEAVIFDEGEDDDFRLTLQGENYLFSDFKSFWKQNKISTAASNNLRKALLEYDKRVFPDYLNSADFYLRGDGLSLTKIADISLNITEALQNKIQENNTVRYSYHGLNHINSLLMAYETLADDALLYTARELFSVWETVNFYSNGPEDERYTWYDHGTGERLLVMTRFWSIGVEKNFDVRFMGRLLYMIKQHADLLANEFFYSRNQNYRYHNHGLFQDIALLGASIAFSFIDSASVWQEIAMERMKDQFENLVLFENNAAIFKENSPGYHDGTIRIVSFINELLKCAENADAQQFYSELENQMLSFYRIMHYPGGRQPAIGDTYRIENSESTRQRALASNYNLGFFPFPKAGYVIAKGEEKEKFWQFNLSASSLTKTHKHEDNLSFTLFFDGIEWFSDPSFFSHQYADLFPAYLRSAKAHNAAVFDQLTYSIDTGITTVSASLEDSRFYIDGKHNAYEGIELKRSVSGMLSKLHLEFKDEVIYLPESIHEQALPKTYWHLGETVKAEKIENSILLSSSLSPFRFKLTGGDFNEWSIIDGDEDSAPLGWIGSGFCMALPSQTIVCSWSSTQTVWSISLEE